MASYDMDMSPSPETKDTDSQKISFRFCREWCVPNRPRIIIMLLLTTVQLQHVVPEREQRQ